MTDLGTGLLNDSHGVAQPDELLDQVAADETRAAGDHGKLVHASPSIFAARGVQRTR